MSVAIGSRLYLSGPMTGIEAFNYPAFMFAAHALRKQGYIVFNPAELQPVHDSKTWHDYMKLDIITLAQYCDAVAVLPGWQKSRGARAEVCIGARVFGLPVVVWDTLETVGDMDVPEII